MRPRASTASDLRASASPSDTSGAAFVLTMFSRHHERWAGRARAAALALMDEKRRTSPNFGTATA
jgi:hypothetical protein